MRECGWYVGGRAQEGVPRPDRHDRGVGGPRVDRLLGGPGRDAIFGEGGSDDLLGGTGPDLLNSRDNGTRDRVDCGAAKDCVQAEPIDRVRRCEV